MESLQTLLDVQVLINIGLFIRSYESNTLQYINTYAALLPLQMCPDPTVLGTRHKMCWGFLDTFFRVDGVFFFFFFPSLFFVTSE